MTDHTARSLPFYAALTYDGQITFEPFNPLECGDHRGRWQLSSSRQGIWTPFGLMPHYEQSQCSKPGRHFVVKAASD